MAPSTVTASLPQLAKMIDHSLLHPTMTDAEARAGLELAKRYGVATACVKPYSIPLARELLEGSGVGVCPVIGFPHGNSTTTSKVAEAEEAARLGGQEIDMVINVGKALSQEWDYVADEIRAVNEAVTKHGATLKVIFENGYLEDEQIVKLCRICSAVPVAYVKTSTGYAFVKRADGALESKGATSAALELMKANVSPGVRVKAAGGIRTLDGLLAARAIGATRVGATATVAILDEARARGIGDEPKEVRIQDERPIGGAY